MYEHPFIAQTRREVEPEMPLTYAPVGRIKFQPEYIIRGVDAWLVGGLLTSQRTTAKQGPQRYSGTRRISREGRGGAAVFDECKLGL